MSIKGQVSFQTKPLVDNNSQLWTNINTKHQKQEDSETDPWRKGIAPGEFLFLQVPARGEARTKILIENPQFVWFEEPG